MKTLLVPRNIPAYDTVGIESSSSSLELYRILLQDINVNGGSNGGPIFSCEMTTNSLSPILVDTLIHARWILPVRPRVESVLAHHSLAIRNGKIIAILPTVAAVETYTASTTLFRPRHVLLPGLINAHTHSGMTLMRGAADDTALHEWLRGRVWPIEAAFAPRPGFCFDGALLSAAEMTRGGTTAFADMYWDADACARATLTAGLRGVIGMVAIAFPSNFGTDVDDYLRKAEVVRDKYAAEPLLRFAYAPHAPYTVPDAAWKDILARSRESGAQIHAHVHETKEEVVASEILDRGCGACHMSDNAARPLANLDELGLLNENFIAAHMVHLTDREIALCAERGVHVAHCPSSNAKLASGFCLVKKLLAAGVTLRSERIRRAVTTRWICFGR